MEYIAPAAVLLLGLAIGGLTAWLLLRAKIQDAYDRGKSSTEAETAALAERLDARQQTIDELGDTVRRLQEQVRQ